jgi:hypothetical protein
VYSKPFYLINTGRGGINLFLIEHYLDLYLQLGYLKVRGWTIEAKIYLTTQEAMSKIVILRRVSE